nr:helix-turn-helix transcriptional regulator [Escherichia coli]
MQNAERLRKIWDEKRKQLSLSQEKAADILGFKTQGAVSQLLNAKIALNTENTLKFAAFSWLRDSCFRFSSQILRSRSAFWMSLSVIVIFFVIVPPILLAIQIFIK